ncbi:MAG: bifunctional riboflavin kinase/FAD synthetase [Bacillota bacterium]
MFTIYGAANYQKGNRKLFIALGNFDGLHIAHRRIISRTCSLARQAGDGSAVFLFDPHPVTRLYPGNSFLLLSSVKMRSEILEKLGIDYLIIEKFTEEIAGLSPFRFVTDYLIQCFSVAGVVVGFDYTFGHRGRGTAAHLLKWGEKFNFSVEVVPPVIIGDEVVSSSLIRELLARGEVKEAARYLGSYFKVSGKVIRGEGRGRTLGFPTANLQIGDGLLLPEKGVYLCSTVWRDKKYFALTNIGNKPTFYRSETMFVEVFLLDFTGDLYGEELTVEFLHRIRKEIAFPEACSLTEQIRIDLKKARELIRKEYASMADNTCL